MLSIVLGAENPILRKKSTPIKKVDKSIQRLIKEMKEAMKEAKGVGLAAPQIGRNIRLILVTLDSKKVVPMINPEIISYSKETEWGEEGCLSLPNEWGKVQRFKEITVHFLNEKGDRQILKLKNFNARVTQHEIDHLDGILFIDYPKKDEETSLAIQQTDNIEVE